MPQPDATHTAPPAPRYATAWAALVYVILTFLLAWPALGGGFLVNGLSDQYIAGFAFREFQALSLQAGEGFPMWAAYQFGGMPYVAAMHGDIFYPTFLLRMFLETDVAMTWGFIVHLFLAGLFTFLFLRRAGLGFFPSLIGGAAYMMSGQVASYASPGHDGKLFVSALLPLFLWMLQCGIRGGRAWAWGLVAIVVGLGALSPHPQLLQYMLLAGGAWALYLAFGGGGDGLVDEGRLERALAIRRLAMAFGAILLGMLMSAIQYLPVVEYVDWSPRAGGSGWDHAISFSFPPEELINTYIPQFSGILEQYAGRNGIHFHSEYLGVAVLMLAGAAFGRAAGVRRGFLWFWGGMFVVSLLWALGGFTPFYHIVYALVPGTKFFRAPSTMYFVVTFSVAVFAAIGARRALAGAVSVRYLAGWAIGGAVVLLLAATGVLSEMAMSFARPGFEMLVVDNRPDLVAGAVRSFIVVLLTAGVLMAGAGGRITYITAGAALVTIVGLDLWSVERHYWRFWPPASELYASDATIEYIKAQPEPGRVLPLQLGPSDIVRRDPYLHPTGTASGLMVHGVRSVLGYHGNELGNYQELIGNRQTDPADVLYQRISNPSIWRLLNIRYFLTNVDQPPFEGSELLAGPDTNSAGATVYLYSMPGDNPLAWVAPVIVKAPDDAVLGTITDPRFDVRSAALFDTSAAVQAVDVDRPPEAIDLPVQVLSYEPGDIHLRLTQPAPAGSALIVSENYYPGWHAMVDGAEVTTGRAQYTLVGVPLTEGATEVRLTFRSRPYEQGRLLTLLSLVVALALTGLGIFVERRRSV